MLKHLMNDDVELWCTWMTPLEASGGTPGETPVGKYPGRPLRILMRVTEAMENLHLRWCTMDLNHAHQ